MGREVTLFWRLNFWQIIVRLTENYYFLRPRECFEYLMAPFAQSYVALYNFAFLSRYAGILTGLAIQPGLLLPKKYRLVTQQLR